MRWIWFGDAWNNRSLLQERHGQLMENPSEDGLPLPASAHYPAVSTATFVYMPQLLSHLELHIFSENLRYLSFFKYIVFSLRNCYSLCLPSELLRSWSKLHFLPFFSVIAVLFFIVAFIALFPWFASIWPPRWYNYVLFVFGCLLQIPCVARNQYIHWVLSTIAGTGNRWIKYKNIHGSLESSERKNI